MKQEFVINWDKIQTIEDLKVIFKALDMTVQLVDGEIKENVKELFELNLLIEK
jgi:hypothetical protein